LKQQGDGAGEHLNYDKLRVAGHGPGNTRTRRTNTANRAPNMPMHHGHMPVHVCTISILWDFHTMPYQSDEQQTTGAGETSSTTNYQLHGKDWTNRAPVAENLIKHAPNMPMHHSEYTYIYFTIRLTQSLAEASQCLVTLSVYVRYVFFFLYFIKLQTYIMNVIVQLQLQFLI
jgi:hypothetical protein